MLIDYSTIMDSLEQYSGLIKYKKKRDIFSKIEGKQLAENYRPVSLTSVSYKILESLENNRCLLMVVSLLKGH